MSKLIGFACSMNHVKPPTQLLIDEKLGGEPGNKADAGVYNKIKLLFQY